MNRLVASLFDLVCANHSARGSTVGLMILVYLAIPFGNVRVAKAQSQLTTRVDIYNSSTDVWSTAELSQAQVITAATSAGGKALFAGGDRVDLFDASTKQWSTASLSQSRQALIATSVGDLALFAGGYDALWQGSSRVDIYDAKNNQWSQSSLSAPRAFWSGATTIGSRAYFAGGSANAGHDSTSDIVDIYDASSGQWSTAHLSQPRDELAATAVGGKAFFAGGYSQAKGISDVVDIYDSTTDQWSVAHLSEPRSQLVAATAGSKAFFAGGNNLSGVGSAVVDIYDTDTGQWSVASLSQSRYTSAATALGSKAYFAGGGSKDDGSAIYDIVDVYDDDTGLWSVDHLSVDHGYLGGTAVGDLVLFAGGYTLGVPEPASLELAGAALLGMLGFVGLRRWRRQPPASVAALIVVWLVSAPTTRADIFRWDSHELIPGTEGIAPGPGSAFMGWSQVNHNLRYADFSGGVDLGGSWFYDSWLNHAHFTGANLAGARLEQLDLTDADLSGANLGGAELGYPLKFVPSNLTTSNLSGANLDNAILWGCTLPGADLSGAWVKGTEFTASIGLAQAQLASTASYKAKDLQGIGLAGIDMAGWDFSGQNLAGAAFFRDYGDPRHPFGWSSNLTNANLSGANLANANLSGAVVTGASFDGADTRGASLDLTGASSHNTILPDGKLAGLDLAIGERLVVRNSPIAVSVQDHLKMTDGAALELRVDAAPWNSLISFQSGIPVQLGGTLDLTFAQGADPVSQLGHTLHVFDWSGVSPSGAFTVSSLYDWDTSGLSTTGVVTLLAAGGVIAGDSNADGKVDLADFGTLKDHFGAPGAKTEGDANDDGRIDLSDFGLLKANFGKSAAAVPEPSSATLAVLALIGCVSVGRWRRQSPALLAALACAALLATPSARADIFRWDNHELIPGTEGITLGPGVQLELWNTEGHNLRYADFTGGLDLNQASFNQSWLDNARFSGANLAGVRFEAATLTAADLSGAVVTAANLVGATSRGFTQDQLKSTASYQSKDLRGIVLAGNDLTGWDFSGQNLVGAWFGDNYSFLGGAPKSVLTDANLSGANLTGARLAGLTLTHANLSGASLAGATLGRNSFDAIDVGATLSHADLSSANLGGTNLWDSVLTDANLSQAVVTGASFDHTTPGGFTQAQLASTASYQAKDLRSIVLAGNDLNGWDFSGQNLTGAVFFTRRNFSHLFDGVASLNNANLSGANLTGASLVWSSLANANLSGAVVTGVDFAASSLTQSQLASTASYQAGDLRGIGLGSLGMTGWDFRGQNLTGARFVHLGGDPGGPETLLTNANFSGALLTNAAMSGTLVTGANFGAADTRGAQGLDLAGAVADNTILPDGQIAGLDLAIGERLVVRNSPIAVSVQDHLEMADGGVLELRFDADPWDSPISFAQGIPIQRGGALELTFNKDADPTSQVGHPLHLFDWSGVSPAGAFTVSSLYDWDTSGLYTTGVVTLLAAGGVIAGDSNADGKVDLTDFGTLKDHFGAPGAKSDGDANGDGRIDLSDFGLLKLNFGKSAPGNVAVPEPATWVLAIMGGVWLAAGSVGRRRQSAGLMIAALLLAAPSLAEAQILRWDNGQVIPGTEGITPGPGVNLSGWYTEGHRLSWADLAGGLDLTGANLSHSWFESAHLDFATLADADIAATFLYNASLANANLERSNLTEAGLFYTDLTNANLADADLRNAYCEWPNLHSANLAGALITGIRFYTGYSGTPDQFYSTASYQTKDLHGVAIPFSNLSGWDLSGQNLTQADLSYAALNNGNLRGANLTGANLKSSNLTNSNLSGSNLAGADLNASSFTGAAVAGADFGGTQLTGDQLYSTASYQAHELQGIGLSAHDLSGWNFVGQNLTEANLAAANLMGANLVDVIGSHAKLSAANLTLADLRAAQELDLRGTDTRNAILPDGKIAGLELAAGERLVVRNQSTPIGIHDYANFAATTCTLELQFDSGPWTSGIGFSPGIPVQLGGHLDLAFAAGVNAASQVGRTFKIFDWTGVTPLGHFDVGGTYLWDASRLYTSGEVTLVAPEPTALTLMLAGLSLVLATPGNGARSLRRRRLPRARAGTSQ